MAGTHDAPGIHHDWGTAPYAQIHALQERLVVARAENAIPNILLTGEHPAVITLGRKTPDDGTYAGDFDIVPVERGGEATFHGPGQLVAYPIVHLTQGRKDLHRFQRDLEEIGILTLADFGLEGVRREGLTGVWVGERKIQSLGIAVRRWVTWHGLALNVTTDLSALPHVQPLRPGRERHDRRMAEALGEAPDLAVRQGVPASSSTPGRSCPADPYLEGSLPALPPKDPSPGS